MGGQDAPLPFGHRHQDGLARSQSFQFHAQAMTSTRLSRETALRVAPLVLALHQPLAFQPAKSLAQRAQADAEEARILSSTSLVPGSSVPHS